MPTLYRTHLKELHRRRIRKDFIIKTTSGKIILLETKGDHLIATKKIRLGNTWAQNAGKQFKYYLVYDKLQVEGSKTKEQFLELMKDL